MDTARRPAGGHRRDWLVLLVVVLAATVYALHYYPLAGHPYEDAAMLMRYAQHLAAGDGIVWNVGERPVDGATDFLTMAAIAGLIRLGLSVEAATRLLIVAAHLGTVALVYGAARRLAGTGRALAAIMAASLATGPALAYMAVYFGTTVFALGVAGSWYFACRLARGDTARHLAPAFALASLLTALTRPEGVILTGLFLVAVLGARGRRPPWRVVAWYVGVFAVLGGAYFAWRWWYFGYPLPNPYYKKGGGHLYPDSIVSAALNVRTLCGPILVGLGAGLLLPTVRRWCIFVLVPVVGFTAIWLLLSDEMNYRMRFQYALLPVVLIGAALVWRAIRDDYLPRVRVFAGGPPALRAALSVTLLVTCAVVLLASNLRYIDPEHPDGRYDVALVLRAYAGRGYTIATSEAGLLPLYSGWAALDTWGLNDQRIAHRGGITAADLDSVRPAVIMFHAVSSPPFDAPAGRDAAWRAMTQVLDDYARQHGYILAADFGVAPTDTHYYYVRPNLPDTAALVAGIRGTPYHWLNDGRLAVNYAVLTHGGAPLRSTSPPRGR